MKVGEIFERDGKEYIVIKVQDGFNSTIPIKEILAREVNGTRYITFEDYGRSK